jgi:hypothetical protein
MTVLNAPRRTFTFGVPRHTGLVGKRDTGELIVLGLGGIGSVVAGFVMPGVLLKILGLIVPAAFGLAVVFAPYRPRGSRAQRRTYYRWAAPQRTYRRTLRGGSLWRSAVREAGIRLDGSEPAIAYPPGIDRQEWSAIAVTTNGQEQRAAVLQHHHRHCLTAALEVNPSGLGRLDHGDQAALLDLFGRSVLDTLGNGPGYGKRLQMIARQLRSDPQAHARDIAARGDEGTAEWLRASYAELHDNLSTSAEDHRFYAVLSLDYTPDLAMEAETYGGGDQGLAHVVGRELETLAQRFADARLPVVGPLGTAALASVIRNAYSPDHPVDDTAGMRRNRAWPHEVNASAEDEVTARLPGGDEWHHATAAVVTWPQTPVGVNFLAPILVQMPDVIRTVSVVFTLESNDKALRRLMADSTDDQAETNRAAKLGKIADPRETRQANQADTRGQELAAGSAGAGLVGYLTVSARSTVELRRLRRDVEAKAGSAFLGIEWCDREQAQSFANTLPFASGSAE